MGTFLVQVSRDAGYANIMNNRRYENDVWDKKRRDSDHGEVTAGDQLLIYCTGNVPIHGSSLAFSVMVKEVSSDRATFMLDEPKYFRTPLRRQDILDRVSLGELPKECLKCGEQGFNIIRLEAYATQQILAVVNPKPGDRLDKVPDPWDEFVRRAKTYIDAGTLEEDEIDYKLAIGGKLAGARDAMVSGVDGWPQLLKKALTNRDNNLIHPVTLTKLQDWINESPVTVREALRALWAQDETSVSERIHTFCQRFPSEVISGTGTRINVASVLLMGLNAEHYPPFRVKIFNRTYEQVGYDKPDKDTSEEGLYEHALGFLDRFIEEGNKRKVNLRHRLDAQSVAWAIVTGRVGEPEDEGDTQPPTSPTTLDELARQTFLPVSFLKEIETLLEEKKQVIFQGPPGTGKTFVARKLAECLAGSKDRVTLVQFHPSYAYEDFVQGFRPRLMENGQPGFKVKDGPLLQAAKRAKDSNSNHYLIIDEINRGNLAKVLGELYFLLEYRDEEINLQYSDDLNEKFSLPDNLFIIGTMNTADRSVASVDLALRRRFYFVEFYPDEEPVKSVLRKWLRENAPDMDRVADAVDRANDLLKEDRHAAIGPSYFMRPGLNDKMVDRIWEHSVLPYIEELTFNNPERMSEFELDKLKKGAATSKEEEDDVDETG